MMILLFWSFVAYSFLGFLLETLYALLMTGQLVNRKTQLLLPLCPVYGLGALAILALSSAFPRWIAPIIASGVLMGTAVEYLYSLLIERAFRVRFWDYSDMPGSLHGRVHVSFSAYWGALALALVLWIDPFLAPYLAAIPDSWLPVGMAAVAIDVACTSVVLFRFGRREGRAIGCPVARRVAR